jgi:hypothetical protein
VLFHCINKEFIEQALHLVDEICRESCSNLIVEKSLELREVYVLNIQRTERFEEVVF